MRWSASIALLSVLYGTGADQGPALAHEDELPFRTVSRRGPLERPAGAESGLSLAFRITETDLVCESHEVLLLVSAATEESEWVVANRVNISAERLFRLEQRPGAMVMVVTRCPKRAWYSAHGPFRWRVSGVVLELPTDAARTIRVRTAVPSGYPLRLVVGGRASRTAQTDCARHPDGVWECIGVPARARALAVFEMTSGPHWALATPRGRSSDIVETRPAGWGRLVRLRGVDDSALSSVRLGVLREKQPSHRRRTNRPVLVPDPTSDVHPLDPVTWWLVGSDPVQGRLLEARGASTATHRIALGRVVGELPSLPFPMGLVPGITLRGVVVGPDEHPVRQSTVSVFEYHRPSLALREVEAVQTLRWVADVASDQDGRFEVDGLAAKRYEFVAVHPALGRAVTDWEVDARLLRIALAAGPRLRGRVISGGHPLAGVAVQAVPRRETFEAAEDPMAVVAPGARTTDDGRFDLAVPAEGDGQLLVGGPSGPRARLAYPDVSGRKGALELGDIELPPPVDVHVLARPGCDIRAVGPVGELGMATVDASHEADPGLYRFRLPEAGVWWLEAVCAGGAELGTTRLVRVRDDGEPLLIRLNR